MSSSSSQHQQQSSFSAVSMIHTKRWNTRPHTDEELEWFIKEYSQGRIPDYQMSAWLMAVCFSSMNMQEQSTLTRCMVNSGKTIKWPPHLITVDKHSTGGVGDKISLILAPLVASLDDELFVPMMAGRGLDHTGGTLDKLESIPGYRVNLSIDEFQSIVESVGCSIVSASSDMVLADRKLYALRDVTGTVSCIPLQVSSIVSKKIAEGPQSLVLDVKYGRAAFQATFDEAHTLARNMIYVAEQNHVQPTTAFLTRMDHPIGHAVGNWLEVKECIDVLQSGEGATDLLQLVLCEAAQMLQQTSKYKDRSFDELVDLCWDSLKQGKAFRKFRDMVEAHGGDVGVLDHPETYPEAKYKKTILASQDGYIADIDALIVGRAAVDLGAGRRVADEPVDAEGGIQFDPKVGDAIQQGDVVATVYTNRGESVLEDVCGRIEKAIAYSTERPIIPNVITHRVSVSGVEEFAMPSQLL